MINNRAINGMEDFAALVEGIDQLPGDLDLLPDHRPFLFHQAVTEGGQENGVEGDGVDEDRAQRRNGDLEHGPGQPALSDPHSWWCGDPSDTSFVPPNLQNALFSPLVDISGASACTVHFAQHFAIPTVDNDYIAYYGTADGGANYYGIAAYWGDFGSCDGWGGVAYNTGFDIGQFNDPSEFSYGGFVWIMYTTDNGCGPGAGGDAGFMMNVQDLETAVRLKLNVVYMVWEDGEYGLIKWKQQNQFAGVSVRHGRDPPLLLGERGR